MCRGPHRVVSPCIPLDAYHLLGSTALAASRCSRARLGQGDLNARRHEGADMSCSPRQDGSRGLGGEGTPLRPWVEERRLEGTLNMKSKLLEVKRCTLVY